MTAYYNEIDPFAAQWLRNLIDAGHIPPGDVDERSIVEVSADDLAGYVQCHFFAGIGVWSYALRQAGWPDDRPVWTGSCPCQPFSAAGNQKGINDDRHLWPAWFGLIEQREPDAIFGEQVASAAVVGKINGEGEDVWFDVVHAQMEDAHYAIAGYDLPAAIVGAPHVRQRLFFVAERLADRDGLRRTRKRRQGKERAPEHSEASGVGDTYGEASKRDSRTISGAQKEKYRKRVEDGGEPNRFTNAGENYRPREVNGFWKEADWLGCRDDKFRPVESGTFPLAHGAASRVGRVRAYGNAICAEVAVAFIDAYLEGK